MLPVALVRYLAAIVALLLAVLLVPRSGALIEDFVHVLETGHTLHDSGHHEEPPTEHGCSGPYHSCPCHSTVQFIASGEVARLPVTPAAEANVPTMIQVVRGTEHRRGVERPPSA